MPFKYEGVKFELYTDALLSLVSVLSCYGRPPLKGQLSGSVARLDGSRTDEHTPSLNCLRGQIEAAAFPRLKPSWDRRLLEKTY